MKIKFFAFMKKKMELFQGCTYHVKLRLLACWSSIIFVTYIVTSIIVVLKIN